MSQTVAGTLVGALEKIGVKHIFGLIGNSLNPLADAVRHSTARRLLRNNRARQHPSRRRPL
jgi:thiamine pyrophosphate-dependent acetolactate synthase large subunit-like protein